MRSGISRNTLLLIHSNKFCSDYSLSIVLFEMLKALINTFQDETSDIFYLYLYLKIDA